MRKCILYRCGHVVAWHYAKRGDSIGSLCGSCNTAIIELGIPANRVRREWRDATDATR